MAASKRVACDLEAVEQHITEMEDRIARLRAWIDRDRASGQPMFLGETLLRSFDDTLNLDRRRRIDLIVELAQPGPR